VSQIVLEYQIGRRFLSIIYNLIGIVCSDFAVPALLKEYFIDNTAFHTIGTKFIISFETKEPSTPELLETLIIYMVLYNGTFSSLLEYSKCRLVTGAGEECVKIDDLLAHNEEMKEKERVFFENLFELENEILNCHEEIAS